MTDKKYKEVSLGEFTKAAEVYETDQGGVYKMCKKDYPDVLEELEREPFDDLLDCGCGPAPMLSLLHEKYPEKHLTGIDLTPKMIEVAKAKNMEGVELVVGDCEKLPFEDESFDAVICCQSFHHYPNVQDFFDSVYRVLRPGGRLILRDMTMDSRAVRWFCNHIEIPFFNLLGKGDVRIYGREDVDRLCRRAGLVMECFEKRGFCRLHCVARKPVAGEPVRRELMKADYKNWVPKGMIYGLLAGTGILGAGFVTSMILTKKASKPIRIGLNVLLGAGTLACGKGAQWSIYAYNKFSYNGKRQLSKQIIEGTAEYIKIPDGGVGLDVGCGSGALTIACAKRNPNARMMGIDRWGKEYASFSKQLCEDNTMAEGVDNVEFAQGDATKLDFEDESFDAVTSNYVYHNITGVDKQELLLETLRVLKKGGTFAIHDIMSKRRYGDMKAFEEKLKAMGYEEVRLIPTDDGKFMSRIEGKKLALSGSMILVGRK